MGYDVSYHLGAPWYCNHITVVPLLPSVVYRNCKQRGICDLVFWILRDTALLTLKETSLWGSVAGSMAALQVGVSQYAHTAETFHISWKKYPTSCLSDVSQCIPIPLSYKTYLALFCLRVLRRKHSLKYSLHKQINNTW